MQSHRLVTLSQENFFVVAGAGVVVEGAGVVAVGTGVLVV